MLNHSEPPKKCFDCKHCIINDGEFTCSVGIDKCIKDTDWYKKSMEEIAMIVGTTNNDIFFKYSLSKNDRLYPALFDVYFFRHLLLSVEDKRLDADTAWKAYLNNGEDRRIIELIKKEEFDRL